MRRWLPIIALLATATLCGCAGVVDPVSEFLRAGPWWQTAQTDGIRSRARELEAQGEFAMALDHWRLVHGIARDRTESADEITRLEKKIAQAVQAHYQNGLSKLGKKEMAAARNHFLAALRLDPGFQPALKQIKARFSPFPLAAYRSVPGDSPATVAGKFFGDEKKAFLVVWFNDLPEKGPLPAGTLLILPKLKKIPVKRARKKKPPLRPAEASEPPAKNDRDLENARARFDQGRYAQSLDLAEAVLIEVPDSIAARDLAAEARYRVALDHFDHQRLVQARTVLESADEKHEASMALMSVVHARLNERAQVHYRNGVKHFINDDLKAAIAQWEKTLACNPDHAKARENIDSARRLLEKIRTLP